MVKHRVIIFRALKTFCDPGGHMDTFVQTHRVYKNKREPKCKLWTLVLINVPAVAHYT